jgi:hypothetical protein
LPPLSRETKSGVLHLSLCSGLLGVGELLSYCLGQFVHFFGLRRDFGRQLFLKSHVSFVTELKARDNLKSTGNYLRFGQPLLGQLRSTVAIVDEGFQVFGRLKRKRLPSQKCRGRNFKIVSLRTSTS